MVMEAFSNPRSAYHFEKLRHEERVVEGFPFMTRFGARRYQSFVEEPLLRMEMGFVKENRASRVNFIPFIGLRGSPFRWKGCLGE